MSGPFIAVVGGGVIDEDLLAFARSVGRDLARAEAILVCGGLGPLLTAAMEGASDLGGTTVALLPSSQREPIDVAATVSIPTGLGEARNVLIARTAQAMIAIGGGYGTLSEMALAARIGTPIVGYRTWHLQPPVAEEFDDPVMPCASAEDAVTTAIALARARESSPGSDEMARDGGRQDITSQSRNRSWEEPDDTERDGPTGGSSVS